MLNSPRGCGGEEHPGEAELLHSDQSARRQRPEHACELHGGVRQEDGVREALAVEHVREERQARGRHDRQHRALRKARCEQHPVGLHVGCDGHAQAERRDCLQGAGYHQDDTLGEAVGDHPADGDRDEAGGAECEHDAAEALVVAGQLVGQPSSGHEGDLHR